MRPGHAILTLALAALVAGLGYFNWHLAESSIDTSAVPPDAASLATALPESRRLGQAERDPKPLAELGETVGRPLFQSTRRPLVIETKKVAPATEVKDGASAEPTVAEASGLSLVGVMKTGATSGKALLRPEGALYGTWVELGQEIGGWRVACIEANSVVIEKASEREELVLHAR